MTLLYPRARLWSIIYGTFKFSSHTDGPYASMRSHLPTCCHSQRLQKRLLLSSHEYALQICNCMHMSSDLAVRTPQQKGTKRAHERNGREKAHSKPRSKNATFTRHKQTKAPETQSEREKTKRRIQNLDSSFPCSISLSTPAPQCPPLHCKQCWTCCNRFPFISMEENGWDL